MIDLCVEEENQNKFGASLKVIGVGGAGGNAVNSMINSADMEAVSFMVANTDAQSLSLSPAQIKIQLGSKITKGLGAGSNPDVGRRSAEEDIDNIMQNVEQADILFLTGGLGGGTGSGALPVIAAAAREMGILTIAIVTKPFLFEGKRRTRITEEAISNLKSAVDTLIVVPNQRLLEIADEKISMLDAFSLSNDILKQAIKGISDIITKSGHINVDFADVRAIMKDMGMALMGTGRSSGENRARDAASKAISSPLLENVSIKGAKGVLINITGNVDLGLYEINEAASLVYDLVSEDANIILGSVIDPDIGDEVLVTVIATGFETVSAEDQMAKHTQKKQQEHLNNQVATQIIHGAIKELEPKVKPEPVQNQVPVVSRVEKSEVELQHENLLEIIPNKANDVYDMQDLDTPTFLRKKTEEHELKQASQASQTSKVVEYKKFEV